MGATSPGMRITGWGTALPDKVVTNQDLEVTLDTSDAWIVERTGIHERRIGGTTAGLAAEAGAAALAQAGLDGGDIDVVVLATSTPDQTLPASSAHVHELLGIRGGAFDLNAACSGFVYALVAGAGLVATGSQRVLVIGSDTMSRITDWDDRGTAILFADGAGAVVLEAADGPGALLSYDLGAEGTARHLLYAELGGTMIMDGREVFRRAVRSMVASVEACLDRAGVRIDQVALLVPHQANQRIIDAAASRLGLAPDRTASVLAHTGNTSAGSVPLALVDAVAHGRLGPGDLAVLCGFGAGMTVATALVRWDAPRQGPGADPASAAHPGPRREPGGAGHRRRPRHRPGLRPGLRRRRRPGGGHPPLRPPHPAPTPMACCGWPATSPTLPRSTPPSPPSRPSWARSRCWWPTPASPTTCWSCAWTTRPSPTVVDTNLTGGFRTAKRAVQKMMRARWGRIIFISSVVGSTGQAGQANYAASKAGLLGLARSLAREFASRQITVNVVAPGPVTTLMTGALSDDRQAAITDAVPLGRFATPDEIAQTVRFLASDAAGYITGALIPVDGGLGMGAS